MSFSQLLNNNDILYEISKHLETNDIINLHLAFNIPIHMNVLRLLDKFIMCQSCYKYENKLYDCYYCNKQICLYCSVKCKKCKIIVCNAYECNNDNKDKNDKSNHNFRLMINKYNCRNHKIICSIDHTAFACECKKGIKCKNCLCILCANCGQSGLCELCDAY